jgi:hypothetical protein
MFSEVLDRDLILPDAPTTVEEGKSESAPLLWV